MWMIEHSVETTVEPEALWRVVELELQEIMGVKSRGGGELQRGATSRLKLMGGLAAIHFVITQYVRGRSFTVENGLALARMAFEIEMEPDVQRTRVLHRVRITGLLAPLWGRLMGQMYAKDVRGLVERIVAAAAILERKPLSDDDDA